MSEAGSGSSDRAMRAFTPNASATRGMTPALSADGLTIQVRREGDWKTVVRGVSLTLREGARKAGELLEQVGIPNPGRNLHRYPHELSGGMRQRVLIAMALACDPAVLLADEPTTAIDVTIQAQILQLIRELARQRGLAVLLVTHDLAVASQIADHVQVLY